ncbi:MAG: hypothetical protein V4577_01810 [Bacteroidota bacterium]
MKISSSVKKILKASPVYKFRRYLLQRKWDRKQLKKWLANGRPVPPPQSYKQEVIRKYAQRYNITTFIETGTYYGDTTNACKRWFDRIFSIELDKSLYLLAKRRFSGNRNITILNGDSGQVVGDILENISGKCLFWLDGHYSAGVTAKGSLNTPILMELTHILKHSATDHVILIDDARCFSGQDDYPDVPSLEAFVYNYNQDLQFYIEDDIIRIHS